MATTFFSNGTVITADWLNAINTYNLGPGDAAGDGVTNDSVAFQNALNTYKSVRLEANKIYNIGDVEIPINGKLDLNGAVIRRVPGARHAIKIENYRSSLVNGEVRGSPWIATTFSANSSGGTASVTVSSATGLVVGMACVYPSAWADGGIEVNEIINIVGNVLTLAKNLEGNVVSGAKFLADFPIIKTGGSQYAGSIQDLFIRDFLFGLESGNNGEAGTNSFTGIQNIVFEDYVGAALYISANTAAESFANIRGNGGKTLATDYVGNGSTVRFAIPYNLAKKCYRWGSEPTIRLIVNGTRLATTAYTVDLATMEVVANVAPANGATVQIQNYEYSAFGIVGLNINKTQASSIEGMTDILFLATNVGQFYDGCELGFFSNVRMDTCGYAGSLFYRCDGMYCRGFDNLYSPFGVIVDSSCFNFSLATFGTSLIPDSEELTATPNKRELTVRAFSTRIHIDYLSWFSKDGYTQNVADAIYPTESKTHFQPDGLSVGGVPSGLGIFYGPDDKYVQVVEAADELVFDGGSGDRYVRAKAPGASLEVGALGAGGKLFLSGPTGIKITVDNNGAVLLVVPTSSAGLPSNAIWNDAGTLKIVP